MASTSSSTPKTGDAEFINTDGISIETIHVKFNNSQMARCMPSLNAKMVQMPISKSSQNKLKEFGWNLMESDGILWNPMESYGIRWNLMESDGILWNPMESYGIRWNLMESD
ncbi:unnamed protein product [Rotaria sp. Silwood2]|nr:unnamed protein product [Rotaria sp. Silwood2]